MAPGGASNQSSIDKNIENSRFKTRGAFLGLEIKWSIRYMYMAWVCCSFFECIDRFIFKRLQDNKISPWPHFLVEKDGLV